MAVKPLQSLARALEVLDVIAEHEPVGVAELARITGVDKSALQRILVTLHAGGWLRPTTEPSTRWKLTTRPLVLAAQARRRDDLLTRARPVLADLREATGETVILAVPDAGRIVAVDVAESRQLVRTVPRIGLVFPAATSAAGLAMCAATPPDEWDLSGIDPHDEVFRRELTGTRDRGWSLSLGAVDAGVASVGAAVLDATGRPIAALIVSAPSGRLDEAGCTRVGKLVARAATGLGDRAGPPR
ncbi:MULTISPECIES: IclR family transcriptional regulator [unclassified Embleya]|uniref:IclR family transcriptional regulator n=1 Tax=unclassified Embleya TaxID=2699296 RepID=UPI0036A9A7E1